MDGIVGPFSRIWALNLGPACICGKLTMLDSSASYGRFSFMEIFNRLEYEQYPVNSGKANKCSIKKRVITIV